MYTSMGRMHGNDHGAHSEQQIAIWREVNVALLDTLLEVLEKDNREAIVTDIYRIHDRYSQSWRRFQSELHTRQGALISAAENGDFNKCALLSKELILLKARVQATEAAHCELKQLVDRGNSRRPVNERREDAISEDDSPLLQQAKVIPLRRRS